jgi:hypothetical protein
MKKYLLSLLLLVALLTGCNKSNPNYEWKTKTKTELVNFCVYTNNMHMMYGPQFTSDPYCIPSIKWVEEIYAPALRKFISLNGIGMPSLPDNDCVRYSSYGLAEGGIIHANGEGPRKTSLAIGIVDYVMDLNNWHSINVFIVHNEFGDLELYYFEPQNGTRIPNKEVDTDWWSFRM